MSATLQCQDVSLRYELHAAPTLSSVSFSLRAHERVALVGLNGSGKTTLLMALAGLLPHRGEILICGVRLEPKNLAALRRKIGFVFNVPEDQLLLPTVIEDVAFTLRQAGQAKAQAYQHAFAALASLGIGHLAEQSVHHLSHGQKQRVALAGAIVAEPPLLLLDEPSAGLDPPGKHELAALLCQQASAQLIATHDLHFAAQICSRVVLLENGRVVPEKTRFAQIGAHWHLHESHPDAAI